jgi:hypothetical protein
MAALTPTDLVLQVLENLGRVSGDAQLPAATITRRADAEYRNLRRRLSGEFPSIYEGVSTPTTISAPTTTLAKPTDCETIRVLEKQVGTDWTPLEVASSLNRDEYGGLSFYELGANVQILPEAAAPGTYRFIYIKQPATTVTTYDVPDGLERIIVEEVSAWGRQRHNEMDQVKYHKDEAKRIWDENYMPLWNRYGSHGRSVLNQTRE